MNTLPLRRAIAVFVFALAALAFTAEDALATHFRYGTISWSTPNPAQPNVIRVRFDAAFRWSFPWSGPANACPPGFVPSNPSVGSGSCPPIGTTIAPGSIGNITSSVAVNINGGPASTSIPINNFIVTSINQLEDWMTGTFEVTLTFPPTSPGTYTLSFTNCCRVSTLLGGNADANYTVRSTVTVRNPVNRPPTSASLPLIRVPHNVTNATFVIPAFDPDGDPLTFSIPPTVESGLNQSTPPGLTLNPTTGVVTWNTTPPAVVLNGLYSAQFKVTDSKGASTVVDVMLSPSAGVGAPPTVYINGAAAPATFNVLRGTLISFPVAVVAGVVTPVTLGSSALPLGASMLPSLPTQGLSGNVSSSFSWTPAPNQVGSYLISYSGLTGSGQQAAQTVNINVTNNQPVVTCSPLSNVIQATGPGAMPFSINTSVTDADNDSLLVQYYLNGVLQTTLVNQPSPFAQSFGGSLPLGNHTYQIRVTDNFSPTVSCSGTFSIVDATPPALMLPPDATIFATSPAGATHAFTASAIDTIDAAPAVSCVPASGSVFPVGTTTVACTATDASGNATPGTFEVTVYRRALLLLSPAFGIAGDSASITASLTGVPDGGPIAGQTVSFSFGGAVADGAAITDASGVATLTRSFSQAGSFTATASFLNPAAFFADHTGALPVIAEVASAPISVQPAATALAPLNLPVTMFVGDSLTISTTLTRVSAPAGAVGGASVAFTVTGTSPIAGPPVVLLATTTPDGGATVAFTPPSRGTYSITAGFAGDSALLPATASGSITAYQRTTLLLGAVNATAGAAAQVTATLMSVPGNSPVAGETVTFSFGGVVPDATANTGSGGIASSAVMFPHAGNYPVVAIFQNLAGYFADANGNLIATSASSTATISSAATSLSVTAPATALVGEALTLASVLNRISAPAGAVSGAVVTYLVTSPSGAVTTLSASTDATGASSASAPLTSAGVHTIQAQFAGDSALNAAASTATTLVSQPTALTANVVNATAGTPVGVTAVLMRIPQGAPIAGAAVEFDFGGVIAGATGVTDASGVAAVTVTFPNAGTFPVLVSFAGSPALSTLAASASTTATVADGTAPVITYAVTGTQGLDDWYRSDVTVVWTASDPESAISTQAGCDTVVINADGSMTLTCSATSAGGTATASVTVKRDATAPILTTDGNQTVSATGPTTVVNFAAGTAIDSMSGVSTVSCTPASGAAFALGATTVSCLAADAAGNESTGSFVVTVNDTTPPVLTLPGDLTVPGTNPAGQAVNWSASANDLVSGDAAVTCTPASGSTFGYATQTVTCSAADASGNTASGSFTVTVTDTTAPQIVPTVTGTMGLAGWYVSNVNVTWSVTDAESGVSNATGCGAATVSTDGAAFTFTCVATSAGGTSTETVTVKRDTTAPAITTSPNLTVGATSTAGATVTYAAASALDPASGVASLSCAPAAGSLFPIGTTTVTCTATDNAGNTSGASFAVTVNDTVPPVITATTPSTSSMWPPNHQLVPVTVTVAATDNLGPAPVCSVSGVTSNEPQNGLGDGDTPNDWLISGLTVQLRAERAGNGNGRVYTVAVRCMDGAGNAATSTTTVSVPKSQKK